MFRKRFLILTIFLVYGFMELQGQNLNEKEVDPIFKHAVGAGAGFTTGYGLSYRFSASKYAFQLNFAPYHDKELDRYSIGLTFLYTLIKNKITSLYLYQGNHYYYNSQIIDFYNPNNPDPVKQRVTSNYINNGIGFGIEIIIAKRIGLNLMGGYAFYRNFKDLNLTGETALFYKF
ncbi:MAG: hypothetical protein H7296_06070 [Bacteroidia bacterium]|nr:hypothetical protein [Bacteroidia bacterium]